MSAPIGFRDTRRICRNGAVTGVLALAALLAACTGSTGSQGPSGPAGPPGPPGPSGPPGGGTGGNINSASSITGTTTSAVVQANGATVVKFQLVDQNGAGLKGLQASAISFAIAQLTPGQNGMSSVWTSYITKTETPSGCPAGVTSCANAPTTQASTEKATSGALVDNGDGTYQYTFAANITTIANPKYDASLTHRVGFEIRGLAQANNGIYTWQPSTGATSGIFSRQIVKTATCNNCHGFLSAHGGARVDTDYCVICHSPQTSDAYSANTVDMKVMIHKIHTGINLPTINTVSPPNTTPTLGQGYWIIGNSNSVNNFNEILFPQDTRNCVTCHVQTDPAVTEAANYYQVPTAEACGSCHDNVNFTTGANHPPGPAPDSDCVTCHGPNSNINGGQLRVVNAHMIPEQVAAGKFLFLVNSVTFSVQGGSTYPVINFSVVDPTNANKPYNIFADAPFVGNDPGPAEPVCESGAAALKLDLAWDSTDYTNWGTAVDAGDWGQPVQYNVIVPGAAATVPATCSSSTLLYGGASAPPVPAQSTIYGPAADGSFTAVTAALPAPPAANCPPAGNMPCAGVQNLGVALEGHPGVVTTGPGAAKIPVTTAVNYGNTAGAAPVARRTVVDTAKCDVCHSVLSFHGANRNNNTQVCVMCHNPASTDVSERSAQAAPDAAGLWEQTIDFKHFIHAIHSSDFRQSQANFQPFIIIGRNGSVNDFTAVGYPQDVGNCYSCHSVPDSGPTFYPGDPATQAMTTITGFSNDPAKPTQPGVPISTTPNMAACTGCHQDASSISHMQQNGGSTTVLKDAEGRMIPASNPGGAETCAVCHSAGGIADVGKLHNVIVPAS
jgi:OmcA/MtrC family decaheme c-type cytochrome